MFAMKYSFSCIFFFNFYFLENGRRELLVITYRSHIRHYIRSKALSTALTSVISSHNANMTGSMAEFQYLYSLTVTFYGGISGSFSLHEECFGSKLTLYA